MRFQVKGPFELDKDGRRLIIDTPASAGDFWDWVEEYEPGLPDACGCYIFAISAGKGSLPWYVGKAERQSFRQESFASGKIVKYNGALHQRERGKPALFFLPQVTPQGKYRKPKRGEGKRPAIQKLELLLIDMALTRNPDLKNKVNTIWKERLTVDGFLNARKHKVGPAGDLLTLLGQ